MHHFAKFFLLHVFPKIFEIAVSRNWSRDGVHNLAKVCVVSLAIARTQVNVGKTHLQPETSLGDCTQWKQESGVGFSGIKREEPSVIVYLYVWLARCQ